MVLEVAQFAIEKFQDGNIRDKADVIGYIPVVGGQVVGLARAVYSLAVPIFGGLTALGLLAASAFKPSLYTKAVNVFFVSVDAAVQFPRALFEILGMGALMIESDVEHFDDPDPGCLFRA